jgi:plastocyanin
LWFAIPCTIWPTDIEGTVLIKHRLTKKRVTPSVAYERSVAVEPGFDSADAGTLAYERTHVAVYLEGQFPPGNTPATLEQRNRRFVPDLLVIPVGSTVSFPNFDPIFHNVFSLSRPKSFDLGNYPKGQTRTIEFGKPGIVLVNCHLHTNMGATIVVAPNQWSVTADPSGRFTLRNVPPGRHTLVAWHKAAGFVRQTVSVGASGSVLVTFVIPLDESGETSGAIAQR